MGGDVAVARPDLVSRSRRPHADGVVLAVTGMRRGVAEDVLAVQLLGDARRGGLRVRGIAYDGGPAAALPRDFVEGVDGYAVSNRLRVRRMDGCGADEGVAAQQRP